ncbi:L7Ae/L30e/S12e/Gadd45 family ribosomal protein [Secundilactobacillus malefermentans]|uniref:Ribosomal protein eL8/eL30/eS12/Gadd45 domain-containing protein n=1 Tax=Secundilactobacillus malefermentans TaxID=176292 RepID=A0A4R5NRK3_9LACO|nr:ribosomal L7Ae/L30e/S12e/Gadd45 family protein [Secundilactobacillus malefermentans]KRM57216.1 50S ribosomal protein L7 [Secundilactobacillus malefermentans DSM 5705 = KCTC 3548]QEA32279.1 hypothetical protein FGL90_08895 [Secundilactobacillus malefermentans]TDG79670.1 hypothetical protein C5L31_001581 [Secundilactobacillus malefermentans]
MKNNDSFLNFLGIAKRAGKLVLGEDLVLKAIKKNAVQLVILGSDTGAASAKKINDKSNFYRIPIIDDYDKSQLTMAIGVERTVVAVNDQNFTKRLLELSK